MARIDVPIKVQLGCDDCYRFLLAVTAEAEALAEALTAIRDCTPDGWTHDTAKAALTEYRANYPKEAP